jgi:hypothetical protein
LVVIGVTAPKSEFKELLVGKALQHYGDVFADDVARRVEGRGKVVHDGVETRFAGAALEDLVGDRIGLEDALGRGTQG